MTVDAKRAYRAGSMEDVKRLFPDELEGVLTFEELQDHFMVKPRQFLGTDTFSEVARIVRAANGEYISSGKDSHFRIPK